MDVYGSFTLNCPNLETIRTPFNRLMDKQIIIHKFSLSIATRFCNVKQNDIYWSKFYHILIDINKNEVPVASHHYNGMTLNKTTLFEDLLHLIQWNCDQIKGMEFQLPVATKAALARQMLLQKERGFIQVLLHWENGGLLSQSPSPQKDPDKIQCPELLLQFKVQSFGAHRQLLSGHSPYSGSLTYSWLLFILGSLLLRPRNPWREQASAPCKCKSQARECDLLFPLGLY